MEGKEQQEKKTKIEQPKLICLITKSKAESRAEKRWVARAIFRIIGTSYEPNSCAKMTENRAAAGMKREKI